MVILSFMLFSRIQRLNHSAEATISGSFTLNPCNDTLTINNSAATGYQAWPNVSVGIYSVIAHDAWFKYNLTEAYRGTITITEATLYFYLLSVDSHTIDAYTDIKSIDPTNETWIDSTISGVNMPSRYGWEESYTHQYAVVPNVWKWFELYAGNSTQGIGALQDAYNNNRTKTYILEMNIYSGEYYFTKWTSREHITLIPYLTVLYTQAAAGESEAVEATPQISNPIAYTLKYYPVDIALVSSAYPNTTMPVGAEGYTRHSTYDGFEYEILFRFNMSYPDNINMIENDGSFILANKSFAFVYLGLWSYCTFVPTNTQWLGYDILNGVNRANESWLNSTVVWNNKPAYSSRNFTFAQYVDHQGYYNYSIVDDQDFIRYTVNNDYTYTLVYHVDSSISNNAYSLWALLADPHFPPFILGMVNMENQTVPTPLVLSWTTAHILFGNGLSLDSMSAGFLLSGMVYLTFMVPIAWIVKKNKLGLIVISTAFLTFFATVQWLRIEFYILLLILTVLIYGKVLKS